MSVEVGQPAPGFTLKSPDNEAIALSAYRGQQSVLLVFYPFAFSSICTGELAQVRDELPTYQNDDVQVLAVSTDPTFALKAYADTEGYKFPLLSDFWPHGAVARSYGVFNDQAGMAVRGTFLIDRGGIVRFAQVNAPGEARDQSQWVEALRRLTA